MGARVTVRVVPNMEALPCLQIGYFRIGFIQRKYYEPAGKYTFRSGLTQEDIVCSHANDNVARMYEAQESIVAYPEAEFRLFPENPLHMGYFLDNIEDSEYKLCHARIIAIIYCNYVYVVWDMLSVGYY